MKPLQFHRAAREELRRAAEHYAAIDPELGRRFYDALERLVQEVRIRPTTHRAFAPPSRRHFGHRFPYAIIYLDRPDHVWIVAVMHFRQRPGYWADRLP